MLAPLPSGYDSWTQILTDWAVSRAYDGAGQPGCFAGQPKLAAPFVTEISAFLRKKQSRRMTVESMLAEQRVEEPAYDQAGGEEYLALRAAMEEAQDRYLKLSSARAIASDLHECRAQMEQLQAGFLATRARHEPEIRAACAAAVRNYWAKQSARGLPDTFFAAAPWHTAASRLARTHPVWWGKFLGRLQRTLSFGHPAEGRLLDALPRLRAAATKKTLEATIDDWREEHRERWGWTGDVHYRMLALRSAKKASQLARWFAMHAPDYRNDSTARFILHANLAQRLVEADPWAVPAPEPGAYLSEHGRN